MKTSRFFIIISGIIVIIMFTNCPPPLEPDILSILEDETPPVINITSPEDYSEYSTVIELEGNLVDDFIGNSIVESAPEITYLIPGTTIEGATSVNLENGAFSSVINVSGLQGNHTLEISAVDPNGNSVTEIINIVKPISGGDISDFQAVPESRQVTLSWTEVPGAESYTILESAYGNSVSEASNPYVWNELDNGDIYKFQVIAEIPATIGSDAYSNEITVMPLSARDLAPWINFTGYNSIALEWQDNPNISSYTVERSPSPDGPWEKRRNLSANVFIDDRVEYENAYYYRVYPNEFKEIKSDIASAVPGRFGSVREPEYQDTEGTANDVRIVDNYAYIACGAEGLAIIDLTDPENPGAPVYKATSGYAYGISVLDNYAYIADGTSGLAIIDISDPTTPGDPAYKDTSGSARNVFLSGSYAYIADNSSGLAVIDISEPTQSGDASDAVYKYTSSVDDVVVQGNYAYTVYGNIVRIIDVSNPTVPGNTVIDHTDVTGICTRIAISGSNLYVSDEYYGLRVINLTTPSSLGTISSESIPGYPKDVAVYGKTAYLSFSTDSGYYGLAEIDVSNPLSPDSFLLTYTSALPSGIFVDNSTAYLACSSSGLCFFDTAAPTYASSISYHDVGGGTESLAIEIQGDYAFIAEGNGLSISNISNLSDPAFPVFKSINGMVNSITVSGDFAYLQYAVVGGPIQKRGVAIINISNPLQPSDPVYIETIEDTAYAYGLAAAGNYLFSAERQNGLGITDITNPENPGSVVYKDTSGYTRDVAVSGGYAFAADFASGLAVIDLSSPESPGDAGEPQYVALTDDAIAVAIDNNYAYIAAENSGLAIIDISDPENPGLPVYKDTDGYAMGVAVSGDYAYVSCSSSDLAIIDISDPSSGAAASDHKYISVDGEVVDVFISGSKAYAATYRDNFAVINLLEVE